MDSANVLSRCFAVAAEERQRLHSVVQWLTIPNVSYEYSCGRNGGAMVFLLSVSRDQFVFFFQHLPVTCYQASIVYQRPSILVFHEARFLNTFLSLSSESTDSGYVTNKSDTLEKDKSSFCVTVFSFSQVTCAQEGYGHFNLDKFMRRSRGRLCGVIFTDVHISGCLEWARCICGVRTVQRYGIPAGSHGTISGKTQLLAWLTSGASLC